MLIKLYVLLLSLFTVKAHSCSSNQMCPKPTLLSSKEQHQLEQLMLSFLQVDQKPQPRHKNVKLKYSLKYMQELYSVVANDENHNIRSKRGLRQDEISKARTSDVVISMNCINRKSDGVGQRQKLTFSLPKLPEAPTLISAELKLYQDKIRHNLPYGIYAISIYSTTYSLASQYVKMKKIGEKITATDYIGWLSIDVSYIFKRWLYDRMESEDLYVSVQSFGETSEKEMHPASIGIVFQNKEIINEPFIVAFLQADNLINLRLPRDVYGQSASIDYQTLLQRIQFCQMYTMRVSFIELGWQDWVYAPEGYTSAFCDGPCKFPLKTPIVTSNHAIVQSLMNLKLHGKFPRPKCVPIETSQLSVLFRQKENTLLKNYKNMIVRGCGCQ